MAPSSCWRGIEHRYAHELFAHSDAGSVPAAMQPVSLREELNGEALIDKGLNAGQTVVVRGQYRLTPGTVVSIADPNNPAAVPNPTTASAGLLP